MVSNNLEQSLERIYRAALAAVDPEAAVWRYLQDTQPDLSAYRKIGLIGFGKAGVPMARAVERYCARRLSSGMVIVKDGHGGTLDKTRVFEASHPEPDHRGVEAAGAVTRFLSSEFGQDDLLFVAISGGGSALFPLPARGISLEDKQRSTTVLIGCGATIQEINTIRKHLSQVKGGRLLEFVNGARVISLVLSDVIGDDFPSIASGPTSPDPTTFGDCLEIIEKYEIERDLPSQVMDYLQLGAAGSDP
ncbi:MAG: glycerate-2-kinase family protein, partial [Acidobacteriota bacterium]